MMAIHIESAGGKHACYIGDLIPTSAAPRPHLGDGLRPRPAACIEERKRFYTRAIPEQWLVLFTHDHRRPMARIA